jgi:hypothetical protein
MQSAPDGCVKDEDAGNGDGMTEETADQPAVDEAKVEALQAVVDRLASWQDGAEEKTLREELDEGLDEAGIDIADDVRERIVEHLREDASHVDARAFLS